MTPQSYYTLLTQAQVEQIHRSALRVLHEVGVQVESDPMLALLADFGGQVDRNLQRVRFAPPWVERFIQDSLKYDWSAHVPALSCWAGIYASSYLNPDTDELEPFTESTFRDYARLARHLKGVGGATNLGMPFVPDDIPAPYGPLSEKLFGWKHGAEPSGTVQFAGLCPFLVDICARRADDLGQPLANVFRATGYLVSPLRLSRTECEQVLYFRSRGLRMGVGHLLSLGGSAPITIAGAAVLNLAESLFLNILRRALWGDLSLSISGATMVMDLRGMVSLYGRPEQAMVSTVLGQVARWYGASSWGHGGVSDAREPSAQAGMQKALSAVAGLLSCGGSGLDAGLLGVDAICSPEQMVYDAELATCVGRMLRDIEVSEKTCAVEEIKEVGPGGTFMGTDLTAERFRQEVWEPRVWVKDSLQDWLRAGAPSDRARAKQIIRDLLTAQDDYRGLSEECERDLRATIAQAVAADAAAG